MKPFLLPFFFCLVPDLFAIPNSPHAVRTSRTLPTAAHSVPFSKKVPRRTGATHSFQKRSTHTVPLAGSDFDANYVVNATIGGQNFTLLIDTGSADTWVPQQGFSCFNLIGSPVPAATCNFGPTFDVNGSTTFEPFENVSFNITYGTGFFVAGPVGFETVSVGELEVAHQIVPVPNIAGWEADGIQSGILGLAFPNETSLFNTSDPANVSVENHIPYDPFFFTAVNQKKVEHPYFSIALNRPTADQEEHDSYDPNLGFLAFGGIAPVPVIHNTSTTIPVQGFNSNGTAPGDTFFWHAISIDSYNFPGSENVPEAQNASLAGGSTILDTGTALNLVPAPVAAAYAAAFDPPAQLVNITGLSLYAVQCNATVPPFSVTIGGQEFTMDPRDQLLPVVVDATGDVVCIGGTQARGGPDISADFHLLGDVFLRNVVATFNPIDKEVTLTQRVPY